MYQIKYYTRLVKQPSGKLIHSSFFPFIEVQGKRRILSDFKFCFLSFHIGIIWLEKWNSSFWGIRCGCLWEGRGWQWIKLSLIMPDLCNFSQFSSFCFPKVTLPVYTRANVADKTSWATKQIYTYLTPPQLF